MIMRSYEFTAAQAGKLQLPNVFRIWVAFFDVVNKMELFTN
jgi:hypothetical protein